MTRKRRSYSAAEKAAAVRQHLVDKIPVSQIAEQMKVQPTLIHGWINAVMKQAERAFETPRKAKKQSNDHEQKLAALRDKLAVKNEVISELMEENIRSKKDSGEL